MADLSNRGVRDILIACIDGLKGFAEVQLCIVHQIRNSLKYIGSKDQKAFMADLKKVYKAANKELAGSELAGSFGRANENSLLKLLYLGIQNASKKWAMPIQNWTLTLSQRAIFFKDRMDRALKIC